MSLTAQPSDPWLRAGRCPGHRQQPQAAAGQLLFLAGGSSVALEKITPILKAMGRDVVHVGPVGSGARLEADQQLPLRLAGAALAEALSLIERSGLDPRSAWAC